LLNSLFLLFTSLLIFSVENRPILFLTIGHRRRPNLVVSVEFILLVICGPNDRTVVSGVVGVIVVIVIGICNHSQMRTSICTCVIFGVNIGGHPS